MILRKKTIAASSKRDKKKLSDLRCYISLMMEVFWQVKSKKAIVSFIAI